MWWDRAIKGGAQYAKEIEQALAAADRVAVLWSAHSIESSWVRDEAEAGRDSGRLVPASLDGSRPPLGFRQYQTIDLSKWRRSKSQADLATFVEALSGESAPSTHSDRSRAGEMRPTRRALLGGTAAAAVVAVSGGGWFLYRGRSRDKPPPEVEGFIAQARQLMDQNSMVGQNQAVALLERAVKLAPDYAEGWGRLGVVCAVCSHYRERPEALALRAKAEAAGNRALQLDSENPYGEMALAMAKPFIGYWPEWDRRMGKALATEPGNDDLLTYRAVMLQFEGRASEAVPLYQRISEKPFRPAVYVNYLKALWTARRPVELDDAMQDAASLYPTQSSIWFTRFEILSWDRRGEAAVAFAQNPEGRPPDVEDADVQALVNVARAIATRNPADVEPIMASQREAAHSDANQAENAIRNASALGRIDDAFAIADAYYFARGYTIPDTRSKGSAFSPDQRQTRLLFEPVTAEMRSDPRFEQLVNALGFTRYWRGARVTPDYRRA